MYRNYSLIHVLMSCQPRITKEVMKIKEMYRKAKQCNIKIQENLVAAATVWHLLARLKI